MASPLQDVGGGFPQWARTTNNTGDATGLTHAAIIVPSSGVESRLTPISEFPLYSTFSVIIGILPSLNPR